jgi:hypothetical protein
MFQKCSVDSVFCSLLSNFVLNNNFLISGYEGEHDSGGIAVYSRDNHGDLGPIGGGGLEGQVAAAIQHPSGNVAFSLDTGMGAVHSYLLDPVGKTAAGMTVDVSSFGMMDEIVDATGKFLLMVDASGKVHVFTIDSATASFSQVSASEPAGNGAHLITMDPSNRFIIVAQSSNQAIPAPPDQITVFTFDPASGATKKLQSYPVGKLPYHMSIVAE